MKKIYQIDVVKYRLDKRFRNMIVYCFIVFAGVVLLWSIDEVYASSLYLGSFIVIGKFLILILGFGVPFTIWDYLVDRKFYRKLLQPHKS